MIKAITLLSICGLSLGHRLLLTQIPKPLPPPGHTYGAFDQFCPHPEPGIAVCEKITDIASDASNPGSIICERPGDCCLCASISCGSDPLSPCEMFSVGDKGVFGVKNIDITGDDISHPLIDCKGELSCAQTVIQATGISKVQCGGRYSCKDAIIIVNNPNDGFELTCGVTGACDGLRIAVTIPAPTRGTHCGTVQPKQTMPFGSLECVGAEACNNLQFILNNDGCEQVVIESIECRDGSCKGADFHFNGDVIVETCALSGNGGQPLGLETCFEGLAVLTCPSYQSCLSQERVITDPSNGFELKCIGESSCKSAIFTLDFSNKERLGAVIPVYVDCIEGGSCEDMVFIVDNANVKQVSVYVRCLKEGACDGAQFINGLNVVIEDMFCSNPSFCMGCKFNGQLCHPNGFVAPVTPDITNGPIVV